MTAAAPATLWRHLPNALTVLRMALVVPLAWLIRDARYDWAVVVAAIAGLTDALDGFLAKRCGWQSWLGGLLDPIADKLMLVTCFLTLGLVGAHPAWLTWLVVGRDVVIVAGAMAWHGLIGRIHAQPTHLSKLTTCVQILYVLMQLLHLSSWLDLPAHLLDVMIGLTAVLTAVSGLQYVVVWSGKALRWRKAGA
ncbi:MAG: CDP-alcohol phosphatidyltransferase family protein [Xanthomonadaceae bacterium]|nr:CDP-alcohol phosphatidyltransferase family protein [Xanthomonadaceae bacterium]MDE2084845.1 CDP-alcohol phosphatidyltransferase family protein [Xanthomonadaceae bacterium]MDE2256587.1 CDP-alcohol phosphatidyltransferase family protein [Xanthomonadaceae bacterium]